MSVACMCSGCPRGAPADYVQTLYQRLLDCTELSPMYRRKPAWPGPMAGSARWADDDYVDVKDRIFTMAR